MPFSSLQRRKADMPVSSMPTPNAAVGYEHLIADFPDVESVKNDEKRHGDIVSGLLDL